LANQNFTWIRRGARRSGEHDRLFAEVRHALTHALPRIRGALDRIEPDLVVVPGGVYGTSGVFRLLAAERGCRVATFDATPNLAKVCVDGIAAQSDDLPRAFAALVDSGDETWRAARK